MWPGQTRVPPPAYMGVPNPAVGPYQSGQPPLLPDPQWANFQEYQLEQHFSQMSFRQPPPFRPQRPPAGQPQTNATGIPSLLDIHVPRPFHLRSPRMTVQQPPQPQQQPPQPPRVPYLQQPPMVNTSVPPPRITLLQKPRPTRIEQPRTSPVATVAPVVIEPQPQETKEEADVKIQPEPEIKVMSILKRPASTPSNLSLSGADPVDTNPVEDPVQSLKKREEEYANLRLRILGSTGVEDSTSS